MSACRHGDDKSHEPQAFTTRCLPVLGSSAAFGDAKQVRTFEQCYASGVTSTSGVGQKRVGYVVIHAHLVTYQSGLIFSLRMVVAPSECGNLQRIAAHVSGVAHGCVLWHMILRHCSLLARSLKDGSKYQGSDAVAALRLVTHDQASFVFA